MKNKRKSIVSAVIVAVVVVAADQATKALIVSKLAWGDLHSFIPGLFNIVHYKNTGAAFGFLSSNSGTNYRLLFLTFVSIAAITVLLYLISRSDNRLNTFALSLITGGAVGNLIDRARYGSVVDFLDVHIGTYHWPAFNVADSAISTGVVLLLYLSFLAPKKRADTNTDS